MVTVELTAFVDETGELKLQLPPDFPRGEVRVRVEPIADDSAENEDLPWDERPWTDEEIREWLTFRPVPANQIVAGGWEDMDIPDGQTWVEELRRQRKKERGWQTPS